MSNQLADPRALSLSGKLKWGLGAAAVIALGAVAWLYTLSLASIAVAGTATLIVVHGAPWMSQKIANFFLDLRKKDARENPITNRENISLERWAKLNATKAEIEALNAEVVLWERQINGLPADERSDFTNDLAAAKAAVAKQAQAWKEAEAQMQAFDRMTEKVKRKWAVAQTGLKIKRLSEKDKADHINDILATEAAENVDRQLATAFSSLDAIVAEAQAQRPAALPLNPSPVIDVDARLVNADFSKIEARVMADPNSRNYGTDTGRNPR